MAYLALIVLLMILATLGNVLFRWILHRYENAGANSLISMPHDEVFSSREQYKQLLEDFGKREPHYEIPAQHLPLHEDVVDIISNFSAVYFNPDTEDYDRSYLDKPYEANPLFVQIGFLCDLQSAVLVRRNARNPKIYVDDPEECAPGEPKVLATSIEAYFYYAKKMSELL